MQMKKIKILLLGIASLWPALYTLAFFGFLLFLVFSLDKNDGQMAFTLFASMMVLHFFTILEAFGIMAYCLYHVYHNKNIREELKAFWACILVLGAVITLPVYWYYFIYKPSRSSGES
jgi:hypothetical protein